MFKRAVFINFVQGCESAFRGHHFASALVDSVVVKATIARLNDTIPLVIERTVPQFHRHKLGLHTPSFMPQPLFLNMRILTFLKITQSVSQLLIYL